MFTHPPTDCLPRPRSSPLQVEAMASTSWKAATSGITPTIRDDTRWSSVNNCGILCLKRLSMHMLIDPTMQAANIAILRLTLAHPGRFAPTKFATLVDAAIETEYGSWNAAVARVLSTD